MKNLPSKLKYTTESKWEIKKPKLLLTIDKIGDTLEDK